MTEDLQAEQFDPFADDSEYAAPGDGAQVQKRPYSILRGKTGEIDSDAEQGRKLAHHLARIRQAYRLAATRTGALQEMVTMYEAAIASLAEVKRDLAQVEADRDKDCRIDRVLIATWIAEATQFTEPDAPRNQTLVFGDLALDVRQRAVPEKLVLSDEEAVIRQCPGYVTQKPLLHWGDLKKTLTATPHGVITQEGEIIEGVSWTARETVDNSAVLLDGQRIPLRAKREEDAETETDEQGGDPDAEE